MQHFVEDGVVAEEVVEVLAREPFSHADLEAEAVVCLQKSDRDGVRGEKEFGAHAGALRAGLASGRGYGTRAVEIRRQVLS